MIFFLLRRIAATIPVLVIVALIVFLMLRLAPGDPAAAILGDYASSEAMHSVRTQLGLEQSIPVQFFQWSMRLLSGDLGESFFLKQSVASLIAQRIEPTLSLAAITLVVAVLIAVPLGVIAAWRHGGWLDRTLMGFSVLGFSIPSFVIAYVLIWAVSLKLGWLPVQGYVPIREGLWPWAESLILPSLALGITYMALIARITRASMLEVLAQDYIRTATSKGLATDRVLLLHALKNASVPIVTVIGIGIALLISGVVITETVFNIPGLGRLTVDAVLKRDYPIVQGLIIVFAAAKVLVNLVIDISYVFLDPRIRY